MIRRTPRAFSPVRRATLGSVVALVLVAAACGLLLPIRAHLSPATTALVLVVPVVAGVASGGFGAGIVATVTGFLVYDYLFLPPYYTLTVGAAQNWVALAVYAVVTVVVARVVANVNAARREAQRRAAEVRRLFDLSEQLVRESSEPVLFDTVVAAAVSAFGLEAAALLLPRDGRLHAVAAAGTPFSEQQLAIFSAEGHVPVSIPLTGVRPGGVQALALVVDGRAVGLLLLRGGLTPPRSEELLRAFANHLALALDRAKLRDQALRARLLEEVDLLRRSLVGAVSHDLRTPLATIKVSASALRDPEAPVGEDEARELAGLIDEQADRLDRLVSNLLDMTRIQSGALELRRQPTELAAVVAEALAVLGLPPEGPLVRWQAPPDLPLVDVDRLLVRQVLVNLVENALRHAPAGAPVLVTATPGRRGLVEVAVADRGPGVPEGERAGIFEMFDRRGAAGRSGLGLAIVQAFVHAHGQRVWVEEQPGGGARFVFTMPTAAPPTATLSAAAEASA